MPQAPVTVAARVLSRIGFPVQQIRLRIDGPFSFRAGQYLCLNHPDGESIPFSIASAPQRLPELELHFQPQPDNPQATLVNDMLAGDEPVQLSGPYGDVYLQDDLDAPLLIVAGGSGAAQAFGMLDQLLTRPPRQSVRLLWCADSERELYRRQWLKDAARDWLAYELIADSRRDASNRSLAQLKAMAPHLRHTHQIILCGSPGFVYAALDTLTAGGVAREQTRSDVYAYAPRA